MPDTECSTGDVRPWLPRRSESVRHRSPRAPESCPRLRPDNRFLHFDKPPRREPASGTASRTKRRYRNLTTLLQVSPCGTVRQKTCCYESLRAHAGVVTPKSRHEDVRIYGGAEEASSCGLVRWRRRLKPLDRTHLHHFSTESPGKTPQR